MEESNSFYSRKKNYEKRRGKIKLYKQAIFDNGRLDFFLV